LAALSGFGLELDRSASVRIEPDFERDLRPPPASDVAEIVERTLPSVVNVRVTSVAGRGEGSGVIIDEQGVVLTNAHVVEGSVSVRVVFADERDPVEGTVIGAIPERDLAVIKIPEGDLQPVVIGSSENLRLGDDVIAIGYPLGLGGPTVTRGIISGRARSITTDTSGGEEVSLGGLLQTDASINPGNSGGALLDSAGRLIGINTAVAGFAENIGFAIAIDDALPTIEEILSEPPEEHAWLGVQSDSLDFNTATQLGLDPDVEGVVVVNVFPGTPAEKAGIEDGDVITQVDDEVITSPVDLSNAITEHDPGDGVEIVLVTPDGRRTVTAELDRRPVTLEP
jgi:putative serine protease PepD